MPSRLSRDGDQIVTDEWRIHAEPDGDHWRQFGIGAATAAAFAAEGHPLLLLARRIDRLRELDLPNAELAQVDVTDAQAIQSAVESAEERFGPVDCLVNNAGVMLLGKMTEQDPSQWQRMLDVNVQGLLNGIHAVLPGMTRRGGGTIVNISSVAGASVPNHVGYTATKFAVHGLSENLREEVAPAGVRVIVVAPGAVETELLTHTTSDSIKEGYADWKTSIGGAIAPRDVANAIMFAYQQPPNVCIREIVLAATRQEA